jgi:hypothetical protein
VRWITRRNLHVDRTACPWMIRKFIDPDAEFVFIGPDLSPEEIHALNGHTFDMRGAEYGHEDKYCTFEVILRRFGLQGDRPLKLMGHIIRAADIQQSRSRRAEGAGLDAIIRGVQLSVEDDHEKLRVTAPIYDALYAYCQALSAAEAAATSPAAPAAPQMRLSRRVSITAPPATPILDTALTER